MITAVPSHRHGAQATPAPFEKNWVPHGYVGPVTLPGTGRMVFWTGRIAIGLRYAPDAARGH